MLEEPVRELCPAAANLENPWSGMRNIGRTSSDYPIPSPRARKIATRSAGSPAPAVDAKVHAALVAELELLRLRARALTTANTNLRRRLKDLESQPAHEAVV